MATNLVYRYTGEKTRVWALGAEKAPGVPVISATFEPAVTITGTGGYTRSQANADGTTTTGIPAGGVGLAAQEATVATDGTWEFTVTGGLTSTPNNTQVYYVVADGTLTLTASTNKLYGVVDYPKDYVKVNTILPVKIGVFV